MTIISLVIRLTSKGPALFSQQWIGYRGQTFTMYNSAPCAPTSGTRRCAS